MWCRKMIGPTDANRDLSNLTTGKSSAVWFSYRTHSQMLVVLLSFKRQLLCRIKIFHYWIQPSLRADYLRRNISCGTDRKEERNQEKIKRANEEERAMRSGAWRVPFPSVCTGLYSLRHTISSSSSSRYIVRYYYAWRATSRVAGLAMRHTNPKHEVLAQRLGKTNPFCLAYIHPAFIIILFPRFYFLKTKKL